MKKSLLAVFCIMMLAGAALAGPCAGVSVNFGGCGPRYYSPPVCYAPRAAYCGPRVVYYQAAPVYYCAPAPVIYAPACAPVYRAPIVTSGVSVGTVAFGWRR